MSHPPRRYGGEFVPHGCVPERERHACGLRSSVRAKQLACIGVRMHAASVTRGEASVSRTRGNRQDV